MRHKAALRTGVDWFLLVLKVALFSVIGFGLFAFVLQQLDPNNWLAQRINDDATGLTADQFEGLVISGLSQGAMYGLIALGYSMVYGVLGFINFAHGEVFMVGAMTGMITSNKLFEAGAWESNFVASLLFIVLVAIIVSTLTAVVMERVAYRPLRGSLVSSRSLRRSASRSSSRMCRSCCLGRVRSPTPTCRTGGPRPRRSGSSRSSEPDFWSCSLPQWRWRRCGISSNAPRPARRCERWPRTRRSPRSWASMSTGSLSRRLPSVARWLVWPDPVGRHVPIGHPHDRLPPGIKAFSAAVVGGIGNLGGAMAGGVTLGTAESVAPLLILEPLGVNGVSQLRDAVAFAALILVLLVKPTGLFGERLSAEDRA